MAKKIPDVVMKRQFLNVYVCMKCNAKIKAPFEKVKKRKIKCRKCGSKALRPRAKERRGAKA